MMTVIIWVTCQPLLALPLAAMANGAVKLSSSDAYSLSGTAAPKVVAAGEAAGTLEKVSDVDVSTAFGAQNAIDVIDAAIAFVDSQRSDLGAVQNRFENTISNAEHWRKLYGCSWSYSGHRLCC